MKASMHTRPCFSSASRIHFMLYALPSPSGSKPTSPAIEPSRCAGCSRNGSAFDLAIMDGEETRLTAESGALAGERSGRPGEADGDDEEAPHFMQRDLFVLRNS